MQDGEVERFGGRSTMGRGYFVLEPSLTEVGFLDSRGVSEMRLLEGGTAWLRLRPYLSCTSYSRHGPPASSIP